MKGYLFYILVRRRLLNLLQKYLQNDTRAFAQSAPSEELERKQAVIFPQWICDCDLALNRPCLQHITVDVHWMYVAIDPSRMSRAAYERLPRVK